MQRRQNPISTAGKGLCSRSACSRYHRAAGWEASWPTAQPGPPPSEVPALLCALCTTKVWTRGRRSAGRLHGWGRERPCSDMLRTGAHARPSPARARNAACAGAAANIHLRVRLVGGVGRSHAGGTCAARCGSTTAFSRAPVQRPASPNAAAGACRPAAACALARRPGHAAVARPACVVGCPSGSWPQLFGGKAAQADARWGCARYRLCGKSPAALCMLQADCARACGNAADVCSSADSECARRCVP